MAKANRKSNYDLNDAFTDVNGNIYPKVTANDVVFWCSMVSGSTGPTDKGPHGLSPTYENTPVFRESRIGNKTYPFMSGSDAGAQYARVISTDGLLSFSSAGDEGTPNDGKDRPFSVSCWLNLDQLAGADHYIFSKDGGKSSDPAIDSEYEAYIDSGGAITFLLEDESSSDATESVETSNVITPGKWHHVVFTYDGRGGTSANAGLEIYVDATQQTTTKAGDGTYEGMKPYYSSPLNLGARPAGLDASSSEFDGKLAEFAVWKRKLTGEEITAIYNVTREGGFQLISGYLDNPPRVRLIESDSRLGSYPTVARTGDKDIIGNSKSFFDDTNTIPFFGSFATAKITFTDIPLPTQVIFLGPGWFGPGSDDLQNRRLSYVFSYGDKVDLLPNVILANDADLLDAKNNPTSLYQVVNIENARELKVTRDKLEGISTSEAHLADMTVGGIEELNQAVKLYNDRALASVAAKFAEAINLARKNTFSGAIKQSKIQARAEGPIVHLRIEVPMRGMYNYYQSDGDLRRNEIITSSYSVMVTNDKGEEVPSFGIPATISQFAQHGPGVYRYPFMQPLTSSTAVARVATPNVISNITGAALMTKGIADYDAYITPQKFETISPFNESRLALSNDSLFDQVGTPSNVLPGFSAKLASKAIIRLPINTRRTEVVNWTTGSSAGTVGVKSGLVYYNWNLRQWEDPADVTTGSNVDYWHWRRKFSTGSYLATIPAVLYNANVSDFDGKELQPHVGLPTNYAGFPLASKFDATGSQLYDTTGSITAPFVLEKVKLYFSGAIGTYPAQHRTDQAQTSTFMLMIERPINMTRVTGSYTVESADLNRVGTPRVIPITEHTASFTQSRDRRVVWFGRIGQYRKDEGHIQAWDNEVEFRQKDPRVYEAAETWLPVTGTAGGASNSIGATTGSFTIAAPARSIARLNRCTPFVQPRNGDPVYRVIGERAKEGVRNHMLFGTSGGRDIYDISDGRSIIASVPAAHVSSSLGQTAYYTWKPGAPWIKSGLIGQGPTLYAPDDFTSLAPGGREGAMNMVTQKIWSLVENAYSPSPFVILPGDKLILAYANQQMPKTDTKQTNQVWSNKVAREQKIPFFNTVIAPGEAHIELYGSMLRENRPTDVSINQQLTSDAIHEDVRDDVSPLGESRCLDQWMVEPRLSYNGSYLDYFVTGAVIPHTGTTTVDGDGNTIISDDVPSADPFLPGIRQVVALATEGNMTPSGSLTRHAGAQERTRWWGPINSLQRFARLVCPEEIYYDSTCPRMEHYVSASDLRIALYANYRFLFLYNHLEKAVEDAYINTLPGITSNTQGIGKGAAKFMRSFPFEAKFLSFAKTRARTPSDALRTEAGGFGTEGTRLFDFVAFFVSASVKSGNDPDWLLNYVADPWQDPNKKRLWTRDLLASDATTMKALFGFGDGYVLAPTGTHAETSGSNRRTSAFPHGLPLGGRVVPEDKHDRDEQINELLIRGFKHGLINAVPTNTTSVWRHDTFGQFRDMLEQRLFSRMYEDNDADIINAQKILGEPTIEISFRSRTFDPNTADVDDDGAHAKKVKPASTNSQNLSAFYTSSMPYFDGMTKDRFDIQPDMSASFSNE